MCARWRNNPYFVAISTGILVIALWEWLIAPFGGVASRWALLNLGAITRHAVDSAFQAAPEDRQDTFLEALGFQVILLIGIVSYLPIVELQTRASSVLSDAENLLKKIRVLEGKLPPGDSTPPTEEEGIKLVASARKNSRLILICLPWLAAGLLQLSYVNAQSSISGLAHASHARLSQAAAPCLDEKEDASFGAEWALVQTRSDYERLMVNLSRLASARGCKLPARSI